MPNISFYISDDKFDELTGLPALTHRCAELCTGILQAEPDKVHIIYIAIRHGRGHPVYAEVCYRLEPHRTPEVMASFISDLEAVIQQEIGLMARIRCFGSAPSQIYSRN
ncbi:hypothetical protein PCO87_04810 [Pectobacteriaceae bacterium C52]|nr:hypothetical protein PCO87_04810 [Pectobacteriaceae bacterium C52]